MQKELKIVPGDFETSKCKIEGMLQHYGVPTRFIDVVDNHWIALWMGLNKTEKPKQYNQYYHYTERSIPLVELAKGDPVSDELLFQYVLLIAVPFSNSRTFTGIQSSADYIEVICVKHFRQHFCVLMPNMVSYLDARYIIPPIMALMHMIWHPQSLAL